MVPGRLSKRHLTIMSKNSAFGGFKYPKSRHGSTASTDSATNRKFGKGDSSGGRSKGTPSGTQRLSGNQSSMGARRLTSSETSVFSSMFPKWKDEAIDFLTICLDPEPTAAPNCNALLRLPYFTHDNFPSR